MARQFHRAVAKTLFVCEKFSLGVKELLGEAALASLRLIAVGTGLERIGLPSELLGKLGEFDSRWIIPRQPFRQPQTGFGFIAKIRGVHGLCPLHRA